MNSRMFFLRLCGFALFMAGASGMMGCRHNNPVADLPDMQGILDGIRFLDSLAGSKQIDSISQIHDQLTAFLEAQADKVQTAEDKVMFDSLNIMSTEAHDLVTFCNNTRIQLELLEQDTKALEIQYRSGRIKISEYTATLLEAEQMLVNLNHALEVKNQHVWHLLHRRSLLTSRLSPSAGTGY